MLEFVGGVVVGYIANIVVRAVNKPPVRRGPDLDVAQVLADASSERRTLRTKVVGVTFEGRQQIIAKHVYSWSPISLVCEPRNPHDKNAIAVWLDTPRKKIGYLDRSLARRLRNHDDLTATILAVTGGPQSGDETFNYGVNIEILYQPTISQSGDFHATSCNR